VLPGPPALSCAAFTRFPDDRIHIDQEGIVIKRQLIVIGYAVLLPVAGTVAIVAAAAVAAATADSVNRRVHAHR
jgi:hypothetical protein